MADEPLETGLIGGIEKREIKIENYDPDWPKKFEQHAKRIADALNGAALRIEHIGSTSVPGLAAKPIIDILVVVRNSAAESTYLPLLEMAGYVLRVRVVLFVRWPVMNLWLARHSAASNMFSFPGRRPGGRFDSFNRKIFLKVSPNI